MSLSSGKSLVKRNRKRGKEVEKRFAERYGLTRLGLFGKEDLRRGRFVIEAKSRKNLAVAGWFEQVKKHCKEGEIPVLMLTQFGSRKNFVIIEADFFWNEILPRFEEA